MPHVDTDLNNMTFIEESETNELLPFGKGESLRKLLL